MHLLSTYSKFLKIWKNVKILKWKFIEMGILEMLGIDKRTKIKIKLK